MSVRTENDLINEFDVSSSSNFFCRCHKKKHFYPSSSIYINKVFKVLKIQTIFFFSMLIHFSVNMSNRVMFDIPEFVKKKYFIFIKYFSKLFNITDKKKIQIIYPRLSAQHNCCDLLLPFYYKWLE
jgi:hypothetical protein